MEANLTPSQGCCPYPDSSYSNETLPPQHNGSRSYIKPPRSRRTQIKHHSKSYREVDRSVSQGRRFYSSGRSRSQRCEKQIIVKQQPSGWYQVDNITRNLSLAPRVPAYEPGLTFSFAGDQTQHSRRHKRNRRNVNKWQSQNRFPSPSIFGSTLGLLRELPCARLHYDSFRRIFPTLPTRTMREKKFRFEAAKELPFAKYPDDQVRSILESSSCTNDITTKENSLLTWSKQDRLLTGTKLADDIQSGHRVGDTRVTNDLSEMSASQSAEERLREDDTELTDDEEEEREVQNDLHLDSCPEFSHTKANSDIQYEPVKTDKLFKGEQPQLLSSTDNKKSTTISEEFLSLSDTDNKPSKQIPEDVDQKVDNETLPFVDIDKEHNSLVPAPLATYVEVPISKGATSLSPRCGSFQATTPKSPDTTNELKLYATKKKLEVKNRTLNRSPMNLIKTDSETTKRQTECPVVEESISTPQVNISRFDFACIKSTLGGIRCNICGQAAYPVERLEADGQVFHVACFRCHHCSTMLQRGGWNQHGTNYFCNPCHRRIALQTLRH
ncbi:Xin actin-binding repeat-containing protein 2 [Paragonimus heterotremus]|uniref:Xin actin-binding repeat-containing protein 2 n=1 Tax=Paragonimus heterotremus TaxID=100268 RepID=A0A8J4TR41_9TREM|nr:Xin actin-binding repeat-containing protein 2 [Paragonimus heterotremus]